MTEPCAQCAMYRLRILVLKARILRLEQTILKLKRRIQAVYAYAAQVKAESGEIVNQPSGVQRSVMAWNKSRYRVAAYVLDLLRGI